MRASETNMKRVNGREKTIENKREIDREREKERERETTSIGEKSW